MPPHRGLFLLMALSLPSGPVYLRAQGATSVRGRVTILEKGGKTASDVGDAVVWLESAGPSRPRKIEIATEKRRFLPRIAIVEAGSEVTFSNHDPFNHNVFSRSEENPFDLGLYGRGEIRSARFDRPGVVRVYCNVHAQMSAFVVVRDNPWYAQPAADGSFEIAAVPPGAYRLVVWHERGDTSRAIRVPPEGLSDLRLTVDASGFKFRPHLNKLGKPYDLEGRRY